MLGPVLERRRAFTVLVVHAFGVLGLLILPLVLHVGWSARVPMELIALCGAGLLGWEVRQFRRNQSQ